MSTKQENWVWGDWANNSVETQGNDGWVDAWMSDGEERGMPVASFKHYDQIANARQFCAAPLLLDALQDLVNDDGMDEMHTADCLSAARAAIAAATN